MFQLKRIDRRSWRFVVMLVLMTAHAALAENLDVAWQEALNNDPLIKASQSQVSAAEADLAAAKTGRLPMLSASAGITRFDEAPAFDFSGAGVPAILPLFGGASMNMADARITLPVFTSGQVSRRIEATAAALSASRFQLSARKQQIKLAVAEHFIDVLRAKRELAVADNSVHSLAAHVRDVDDMYRVGSVARNEYLAAAVSLADAEQRQLRARNRLDLAHAAYNRALGRPLGTPANLDENLPGIDPTIDVDSLETLTAIALDTRAELLGLDASADAYRNQAASARASARPQLAVTGGYMALRNDFLNREEFWMVGLGLRWHLFDAGRARKEASALAHRSTAIVQERSNLRSLIELEIREAWLRLNETNERKQVTERAVGQAEENLRVVRDRYRAGEGTQSDVLDAETLRSLSHRNFDNAEFDARLALYELARGIGRL